MSNPTPEQALEFAFYTQTILLNGYETNIFSGDGAMVLMATDIYEELTQNSENKKDLNWTNQEEVLECYLEAKEIFTKTGTLGQWFELGEELAQDFIAITRANAGKPHRNRAHMKFLQRLNESRGCSHLDEPFPF